MTNKKLDFEAAKARAYRLLECVGMTEGAINSAQCYLALLQKTEKLKAFLEDIECLSDTDNVKTVTDDGEEEYWVNDQALKSICEEALAEFEELNPE